MIENQFSNFRIYLFLPETFFPASLSTNEKTLVPDSWTFLYINGTDAKALLYCRVSFLKCPSTSLSSVSNHLPVPGRKDRSLVKRYFPLFPQQIEYVPIWARLEVKCLPLQDRQTQFSDPLMCWSAARALIRATT